MDKGHFKKFLRYLMFYTIHYVLQSGLVPLSN